MVQNDPFLGASNESPHEHLENFENVLLTVQFHPRDYDAICLRLFHFSLKDRALTWYKSLPSRSITTWRELIEAFLNKFLPPSKINEMRGNIKGFKQKNGESLAEAWDRFKGLIRSCPDHNFSLTELVMYFFDGVKSRIRHRLNAGAGGDLLGLDCQSVWEKIEQLARDDELYPEDDEVEPQRRGAYVKAVEAEDEEEEDVNYVGNQNRHRYTNIAPFALPENFPKQPNPAKNAQANRIPPYQPPQATRQNNPPPQGQGRQLTTDERLDAHIKKSDESFATLQNMVKDLTLGMKEVYKQLGQLSHTITEREKGTLPSNTETNPKERCNAVTLRSGKELKETESNQNDSSQQKTFERSVPNVPTLGQERSNVPPDVQTSGTGSSTPSSTSNVPPPIDIRLPFPLAQKKNKKNMDESFKRILAILSEVRINIPFIDAILQMPNYIKFFKDILSNKQKWEGNETVCLTEECSAVVLNKLPRKLKDPGSLTIPCTIGPLKFERVLCDSGASINLLPYSIFKKLGLGKPKPTSMTLHLADRSIKHPKGIIEDVIVQVDKFYFPVDFVVLEMEEDVEVPLILGRPFLATGKAVIDVADGKLTLNVGEEKVTFDVFKVLKYPKDHDSCLRIDTLDFFVEENVQEIVVEDTLELCMMRSKEDSG